jgi:hypothetical protein
VEFRCICFCNFRSDVAYWDECKSSDKLWCGKWNSVVKLFKAEKSRPKVTSVGYVADWIDGRRTHGTQHLYPQEHTTLVMGRAEALAFRCQHAWLHKHAKPASLAACVSTVSKGKHRRRQSSRMLRCKVSQKPTDVSEVLTACITAYSLLKSLFTKHTSDVNQITSDLAYHV